MSSENEMTVPDMTEIKAEEIQTDDYSGLSTLLYIIRGLGENRDRKITLAELAKALQWMFSNIYVHDSTGRSASVTPGYVTGTGTGRQTFTLSTDMFKIISDFVFEVSGTHLSYNGGGASLESGKESLTFSLDSWTFTIDKNGITFQDSDKSCKAILSSEGLQIQSGNTIVLNIKKGSIVNEKITTDNILVQELNIVKEFYTTPAIEWTYVEDEISESNNWHAGWRLPQYWKLGQKKRFYMGATTITDIGANGSDGEVYSFTVQKNRFYEFVCVGFTNYLGMDFAELLLQG